MAGGDVGSGAGGAETVGLRTARTLLRVRAVSLSPREPYTWASGIRSPLYTDIRVLMSDPGARAAVADDLAALIRERYGDVGCLAATATGAIPHAAWVAERLRLPMVYVRSAAKEHGKRNLVEGRLRPGERSVVVEDVVSTGGSSRGTVAALRDAGAVVLGVAAIFSYAFPAALAGFEAQGLPFACLTDFPTLVSEALASAMITPEDAASVGAWHGTVAL